jgi:V-type H+-transporting ATPase subunit F
VRQHVTPPPDNQKNFLVVDAKTDTAAIEAAFDRFTSERKDIGIVLINQHVSANPFSRLPPLRTWPGWR